MQDSSDHDLLTQYVSDGSEEAFAALVDRHVNLVYSTELRPLGASHQAEEVAG
jgi:hypothetical protein